MSAGVGPVVVTERLMLRPFSDVDRAPFFALNTHPAVVESLGASPTRAESDDMIKRYSAEMAREGWGLWAVAEAFEGGAGFVGMVGLHRVRPELPCAPAVEIGWRLHPDHWGQGYATEAAAAALRFGFENAGLTEVVAFTTTLNTRSQAVMARIGMRRDVDGDFDHPSVPEGSPLRRHVLYRTTSDGGAGGDGRGGAVGGSQSSPTVTLMSAETAVGGGVRRCEWAGRDPEMVAYHDTEWGVPVHDDTVHFEFLVLEGAQAGLSWSTILKRRAGYRKAFAGFDAAKVARFTPAKVDKLLTDTGIIRNRAKVEATVRNAPRFPRRAGGVRLLRRLHLGLRRGTSDRQQVAAYGATAADLGGVRGAEQGPEAARLRLRRPHGLLRPPPGGGAGQRPHRRLFPLCGAHRILSGPRGRAMTMRVP